MFLIIKQLQLLTVKIKIHLETKQANKILAQLYNLMNSQPDQKVCGQVFISVNFIKVGLY